MDNRYVSTTRRTGQPTDVAKTEDATLAIEPRLALPLIAGLTYSFEAVLFSNAHATPDIKFGLDLPAGSTGQYFNQAAPATAVALNAAVTIDGAGAAVMTVLRGTFVAGASGQIAITWAQGTSDANAATLLAGSELTVTNLN